MSSNSGTPAGNATPGTAPPGSGPAAALDGQAVRDRPAHLAVARRRPHRRLRGNLGWPILLKEIRSDFRKNRFFVTHLVCLAVMAAGILGSVAVQAERSDANPEEIGRNIFNTFLIIQYLVVLVVFPAFSATAFSVERAAGTIDLLLTTDLRPEEIVWGKFLASTIYCLIYTVATIPLLAVSLLFAGVGLPAIGLAYSILIGLTVLLSMAGVFISSCFSSSLRATLTLYAISFGILVWTGTRVGWDGRSNVLSAIVGSVVPAASAVGPLNWLVATMKVLLVASLVFTYLFLFTANQIRPRAEDRTSRLRALTIVSFLALIGWGVMGLPQSGRDEAFQDLLLWSAIGLFAATLAFTAEPADVPPRLSRRFSALRGPLFPFRVFAPGPFWGLVYCLLLSLAACAALCSTRPEGGRSLEHLLTLPLYLFAFGALGFFLSSLDFSPLYTRLTVGFIFIITLLLPVIFWISGMQDGFLSLYYLSPITLHASLEPLSPEGPRFTLAGIPIVRVAQALFAVLGVLFVVLGVRKSRRKGYPLLGASGGPGWSRPSPGGLATGTGSGTVARSA